MAPIESLLHRFPELSVFVAIALGSLLGSVRVGWFRLGTPVGTLLCAMVLAPWAVHPDDGFVAVFFGLFAYVLGYEVGPQLQYAFHRDGARALALALFMTGTMLTTVLVLGRLLGWDGGFTSGVAAGSLAQLPLLGTADQALRTLSGSVEGVRDLQTHMVLAFVATYVPGILGVALVCTRLTSVLLRRDLRRDAARAGQLLARRPGLPELTRPALPPLVGRAYAVTLGAEHAISALEDAVNGMASIEAIERAGQRLRPAPMMTLAQDDRVVVAGRRAAVIALGALIGEEDPTAEAPDVAVARARVMLTAPEYVHRSLEEVRGRLDRDVRHGVYLGRIVRAGRLVPIYPNTQLEIGDVLELYAVERDLRRIIGHLGRRLDEEEQTDLAYLGAGALAGVVLGVVPIGMLGGTLGAGVGALVAGSFFGWLRTKGGTFGALPSEAGSVLKEIGLAGALAALGMNTGEQVLQTLRTDAPLLLGVGVAVSLVPLLASLLFARYVLGMRNAALVGGFLSGACGSPAALEQLTKLAGHESPAIPFAPTYAVACIALSLLGPLIVTIL